MEIFCFFLGITYFYTLTFYLPIILLIFFYITPKMTLILFFFLGLILAFIHHWLWTPKGLPNLALIPKITIKGKIASIPLQSSTKTQFLFELEQFENQPAQGLIQLSWYTHAASKIIAKTIHAGQTWQFTVKLKKPRNYLNPGSTDYVHSLASRHIVWTGSIDTKGNQLLKKHGGGFSWLRLREQLDDKLTRLAPSKQIAGVVGALTLNSTHHIQQEDWDLFRRTGTTHLFGISGEHIALIAGITYGLILRLWSRGYKTCLYIPAPWVASISGLLVASFYALLTGFAPPVQRALIGYSFYTLYSVGKQKFTAWQVWRYALFGVLCLEPHAVFMQGFYFSFLAVACLLLTHQRFRFKGYKNSLALQLSCLIGLMPLTLYWYHYGSINGLVANLFAIPLVGFFIVPLALITMICSSFHWVHMLMQVLSVLIEWLFQLLSWTEHLDFININASIYSIELVALLMGALLLWLLVPLKPFQWMALLWFIIPFFPPRINIKPGEALVQVLDVGQGLAIAIRTKHHVLLYDTGDSFFQGSDMGKMVILPYLQHLGIKKIDSIVISHPDKDHNGGLNSIKNEVPIDKILVSERHHFHQNEYCHNYPSWQWDKVSFRFLPIKKRFKGKNNNSCILQISTDAATLLLTGDIEKIAEDYLVRTYGAELAAEVLLLPHHGSKTSSSFRFLLEVAPRYTIASLGFDNRFHFPHQKTLDLLNILKIPLYRTDTCGLVHLLLPAQGELPKPLCYSGLLDS